MSDDTLRGKLGQFSASWGDAAVGVGDIVTGAKVGVEAGEGEAGVGEPSVGEVILMEDRFLLPPDLKTVLAETMKELNFPLEEAPGRLRDDSDEWTRFYKVRVKNGYLAFLYVHKKVYEGGLETSANGNNLSWIGMLFQANNAQGIFIFSDSGTVFPCYRKQARMWEEKFGLKVVLHFEKLYHAKLLLDDGESRKEDLWEWLQLDKFGSVAAPVSAGKKNIADITASELRNLAAILARTSSFQDDRDGSKRRGFIKIAGLGDVVGDFDYSGPPLGVAKVLVPRLQECGEPPPEPGYHHVLGMLCDAILELQDLPRDDKTVIEKLFSDYCLKADN